MPQVVKPTTVTTVTREGEMTIRLVIELNLNLNGEVTGVAASATEPELARPVTKAKVKEEVEWMVPEFAPTTEQIEFGKYEK